MPPATPKKTDLIRNYLSYLTNLNYKEAPPSMDEFLNSPKFLGKLTNNGKSVYPVWRDTLQLVAKEDSKYIYVLTGAIGCLAEEVKVSLLDGRE